jgi:hypothetical protein
MGWGSGNVMMLNKEKKRRKKREETSIATNLLQHSVVHRRLSLFVGKEKAP